MPLGPATALTTNRSDLSDAFSQFDLSMLQQGYIGAQVFPSIPVVKPAGQFGKITLESLLRNRDTRRTPGAGYARDLYQFTPATFSCEEHGAEEPVDDRDADVFADFFNLETMAAARARGVVLRNAEIRIANAVFNTTTWTGAALTTAIAGSSEWDTSAGVPIQDVNAAMTKVWNGSGLRADTGICSWNTFRSLRLNAEIVGLVKYQEKMDVRASEITAGQIASVLGLRQLLVGGGPKITSNEGAAVTLASIWNDDYFMVAKVAQTSDPKEPCIGRIFHYQGDGSSEGGTMESYREESRRSEIIRVRHDVAEVVLYAAAGHLITNTTA